VRREEEEGALFVLHYKLPLRLTITRANDTPKIKTVHTHPTLIAKNTAHVLHPTLINIHTSINLALLE
jgi:hypothetical protein